MSIRRRGRPLSESGFCALDRVCALPPVPDDLIEATAEECCGWEHAVRASRTPPRMRGMRRSVVFTLRFGKVMRTILARVCEELVRAHFGFRAPSRGPRPRSLLNKGGWRQRAPIRPRLLPVESDLECRYEWSPSGVVGLSGCCGGGLA